MLILFYQKIVRSRFAFYDQLKMANISNILSQDITITYDRDLTDRADAVVFNVPFSYSDIKKLIATKREKQVWIGWSYESEINYPYLFSDEMREMFDIWMTYHLDSDIVLPYYDYSFKEKLYYPYARKKYDICMFISSPVNKSKRKQYLVELIKYIYIDSYGRFLNNKKIITDFGYMDKLRTIRNYKFVIAFENAISKDYVTEKFFDPLIVGAVPIYLGAPNISNFSPGINSFINVDNYRSPKELAEDLKLICRDEELYKSFFKWKEYPLASKLDDLIMDQKIHPFQRLASLINILINKGQCYIENPIE